MVKNEKSILCESYDGIIDKIGDFSGIYSDELIAKTKEIMENRNFVITIQGRGVVVDEQGNIEVTPPTIKIEFQ